MPDLSDFIPAELPDQEPPKQEAPPLPDDRKRAPGTDEVLPANIDAERTILGAVLLDQSFFNDAAETLDPSDFSLDSHKRIFQCMTELIDASIAIDIITLSHELNRQKQIEAVGGVAYLASLTEGLPLRPVIDDYIRIVKDKAMLRRIMLISTAAISRAADQSESALSVLEAVEGQLLEIAQEAVSGKLRTFAESIEAVGGPDEYLKPIIEGKAKTGLATGFTDVDRMTGGLHKGELIILAARPSMGKTAMGINIATNAAIDSDAIVAFFSLEMSRESLERRMMASVGRVDVRRAMSGDFVSGRDIENMRTALSKLVETNIFIDDTPAITPTQMRAKARRLKQRMGRLDLCILDYLQLASAGTRTENRRVEVGTISRSLKAMAKELSTPVLALAQVGRSSEQRSDKRPMLADLRESGDIEADADQVLFIHRPSYYERDDDMSETERNLAEILISKNREGNTGIERLLYIAPFTCFMNMARGEG